MIKEEEILKNRIRDLADRSYNNNLFTFTDFLSLADATVYYSIENELRYAHPVIWGVAEECERILVRFGDPENWGYEEDFPISVLCIKPLIDKFSDDLTHRDILGALMNLGIDRSVLGDILLTGNTAYVYCLNSISEYICDNITKVKHTSVSCNIVSEIPSLERAEKTEIIIQVQSARIDAVIAKVHNLSRSKVVPLFSEKKIFVNGRLCENTSYNLKEGDMVTVRQMGRFTLASLGSLSKKGKLNLKILKS